MRNQDLKISHVILVDICQVFISIGDFRLQIMSINFILFWPIFAYHWRTFRNFAKNLYLVSLLPVKLNNINSGKKGLCINFKIFVILKILKL